MGALHRADTSGTLELCEGSQPGSVSGRRHAIHLCRGLVRDVETPAEFTPVGELLVSRGGAEREAVFDALRQREEDDPRRSGELLVGCGLASASQVKLALRTQLREKLEAVFRVRDAVITFRPPRPKRARALEPEPLEPVDFLHRRPRRRARADETPPSPLEPEARRRALDLMDLDEGASAEEVRRAFRRRAAALHPDRGNAAGSAGERAQLLAQLSAAYHLLTRSN